MAAWSVSWLLPTTWRHNERGCISNHRRLDCLLNRLFRRRKKHQSSASLAFVMGIHRWPVDSPHKGPVKCFHLMTSSFYTRVSFGDQLPVTAKCLQWIHAMSVCSVVALYTGTHSNRNTNSLLSHFRPQAPPRKWYITWKYQHVYQIFSMKQQQQSNVTYTSLVLLKKCLIQNVMKLVCSL